jgi:serine acetyltransferase
VTTSESSLAGLSKDWILNRSRPHIQLWILLLRLAQLTRKSRVCRRSGLAAVVAVCYRTYSLFGCSIDVPIRTSIGSGIRIHHGMGLVIHADAVIGELVTLRQGVTVGAVSGSGAPILEKGVDVGAGAMILGAITIGAGARIGAGAVVMRDVPSGRVVVGNPGREVG